MYVCTYTYIHTYIHTYVLHIPTYTMYMYIQYYSKHLTLITEALVPLLISVYIILLGTISSHYKDCP